MKRFLLVSLLLGSILLACCWACAEGANVVPISNPANQEVNTSYGTYLADIPDPSTILNGGYFKASLYSQDMYRPEDIEQLKPGDTVQIDGKVYTAASVIQHEGGVVEIYPKESESYDSVVFRPEGEVYLGIVNDHAACTYVGDYTFMMPLPDSFRFYWMGVENYIETYDADGFVQLLSGNSAPDLTREYAVISFSDNMLSKALVADYPVDNPDELVRLSANAGEPSYDDDIYTAAASFTLQPIVWDGAGLGKCALPYGYTMLSEVHCGDEETCLGAPLQVHVVAASPYSHSVLGFYSSKYYLERVSGYFKHKEGERDGQLNVFMRKYEEASEFCNSLAKALTNGAAIFTRSEDISFYNDRLAQHREEFRNGIEPGLKQYGIKMNWYDVTAAQRLYLYDNQGTMYALVVMAEVRAYQTNAAGTVTTFWDVPEFFYMSCPWEDYDKVHGSDFQIFTANTAVSDTFIRLQEELTNEIQKKIMGSWAAAIAASNAYAQAMNSLMSQSVNNYLYSSNYSASDRFSDYIFDRNEYTTSDGYGVSISTAYDYVWEGSNGTVYYSNSSFDMPYGATQLYPTR